MNIKGKPLPKGYPTAEDFVEPPVVKADDPIEKDPIEKDPEPVGEFTMKGRKLAFAFDLLYVLNAHKLAERQRISVPNAERFCRGFSPEKVVSVLGFIADVDIDLFSKHDFYNTNVSTRMRTLATFNGAVDDTDFPVEQLMLSFIPEEFSEEARKRVYDMLTDIFIAVENERVKPEDVHADPVASRTPITHSTDELD